MRHQRHIIGDPQRPSPDAAELPEREKDSSIRGPAFSNVYQSSTRAPNLGLHCNGELKATVLIGMLSIWLRRGHDSPYGITPHNAGNGEHTITCRSRCCPKCQAQARRRWLQAQQRDLLSTNYFHVVFTVPHELNPLGLTSRRRLLDLLFETSSQTLLEVAADPKRLGAEIGFLSILHTWSSNLLPHYHIHAVVPAGGLSPDHQRWIPTAHPLFLLPIPVLRTVFRKKFLD